MLRFRRAALFLLFSMPGLAISSWVTRTPAIRDALGASTAGMGVVLFGLSVGSMIGILSSGPLVARLGTKPVIIAGILGVAVSMPTIGLGAAVGSSAVATFGLLLFGLGMGGSEIAMNVEGADIEALIDKPVLPALHGCFSLGTAVGATLGIAFTAVDFPVLWHLTSVSLVAVAALMWAARLVPSGVGVSAAKAERERPAGGSKRYGHLIWIGVIVLAMALAEGTANDWLPLVMVDGHGFDPTLGSAVYAVFAASMAAGRFAGGMLLARFSRVVVLRASAVAGALGLGLVVFADHPVIAGSAVILWGIGAALGFPLSLSAAADAGDPAGAAARVSLVATVGYVAFLVGPPMLGYLGEHYGLRYALIVPLVLVAAAVFLAPAVKQRRREPSVAS